MLLETLFVFHLDWDDQFTVLPLLYLPVYLSKYWLRLCLEHDAAMSYIVVTMIMLTPHYE